MLGDTSRRSINSSSDGSNYTYSKEPLEKLLARDGSIQSLNATDEHFTSTVGPQRVGNQDLPALQANRRSVQNIRLVDDNRIYNDTDHNFTANHHQLINDMSYGDRMFGDASVDPMLGDGMSLGMGQSVRTRTKRGSLAMRGVSNAYIASQKSKIQTKSKRRGSKSPLRNVGAHDTERSSLSQLPSGPVLQAKQALGVKKALMRRNDSEASHSPKRQAYDKKHSIKANESRNLILQPKLTRTPKRVANKNAI